MFLRGKNIIQRVDMKEGIERNNVNKIKYTYQWCCTVKVCVNTELKNMDTQ